MLVGQTVTKYEGPNPSQTSHSRGRLGRATTPNMLLLCSLVQLESSFCQVKHLTNISNWNFFM